MVGDDYAYQLKEMPGIDERLVHIIARMIAREEERYSDIREVIADMEGYLRSVGPSAGTAGAFAGKRYGRTPSVFPTKWGMSSTARI